MRTLQKEVDGLDWGDAAVMNCHWRGPRLRDVLLKAGLDLEGKDKLDIEGDSDWHVAFACYATKVQEDSWYGGSIPLDRGLSLDGDVILALEVSPLDRVLDGRVDY
jgi:sulfite oxidase